MFNTASDLENVCVHYKIRPLETLKVTVVSVIRYTIYLFPKYVYIYLHRHFTIRYLGIY